MNKEAVMRWYEVHSPGLFRFALGLLGDRALAEDAVQETFLRALQKGGAVLPGRERAWLYRVERNVCLDILRRRKRESIQPEVETPALPDSAEQEFLALVEPLEGTDRDLVCLRIVGGLSHREIAEILHLTPAGAQKRYERAIHKLRLLYEEVL